MKEKLDLTNNRISQEELLRCKELASKLNAAAPDNATIQQLVRSLELGYEEAAKNFYQNQLDKFRSVPSEALRIIREEWE